MSIPRGCGSQVTGHQQTDGERITHLYDSFFISVFFFLFFLFFLGGGGGGW